MDLDLHATRQTLASRVVVSLIEHCVTFSLCVYIYLGVRTTCLILPRMYRDVFGGFISFHQTNLNSRDLETGRIIFQSFDRNVHAIPGSCVRNVQPTTSLPVKSPSAKTKSAFPFFIRLK